MAKAGASLHVLANGAAPADAPAGWLTVPAAAARLGVSERRLRRYLERHADHVTARRQGRRHLVAEAALAVLARIAAAYGEGASARDVDVMLAGPEVPAPQAPTAGPTPAALAEEIAELRGAVAALTRSLENRDRLLRRALISLVDLIQINESERHIAERERDDQAARRHREVLAALQIVAANSRRRFFSF